MHHLRIRSTVLLKRKGSRENNDIVINEIEHCHLPPRNRGTGLEDRLV